LFRRCHWSFLALGSDAANLIGDLNTKPEYLSPVYWIGVDSVIIVMLLRIQ